MEMKTLQFPRRTFFTFSFMSICIKRYYKASFYHNVIKKYNEDVYPPNDGYSDKTH